MCELVFDREGSGGISVWFEKLGVIDVDSLVGSEDKNCIRLSVLNKVDM